MSSPRSASFLFLVIAVLAAACSGTEASPTPSAIAARTAATQNGTVGVAVAAPPSVTVTSSKGGPLAGASVTFAAADGGVLAGATATTDEDGVATVGSWTLGHTTGNYTLTATVGSLTAVTFTATAAAGAPASLAVVSGNAQTAAVGAALATPVVVLVKDQYNNPVPGTSVTVAVTTGGGNVSSATASTNAQGQATLPAWTLGTTAGANSVTATAGAATPLVITATGTAGAPVALQAGTGDAQSGDLGTPLTLPLSAKVVDQYGNGVSGTTVTFAVTTGGGTLGSASAVSNAQGVSSTSFTLTAAGVTTVTASSGALTSVVLSANTGPTISGQITIGAAGSMVTSTGNTAAARSRGLLAVPALPRAASPYLTAEQAARRVDTRGRIVITFKPQAMGLPAIGSAYRSGGNVLRSQAVASYQSAIASRVSSTRVKEERVEPSIAAARLILNDPATQEDVMAELRKDPRIATVEQEGVSYTLTNGEVTVPPEELLRTSWSAGTARRAAPASERYAADPLLAQQLWHYRMIDAFRAWPLTTGSATVRVGIIDTGIRSDHPALAGMVSTTEAFDFVDGITTAYSFAQPVCSGGTFLTFRGLASYASIPRTTPQDPMQYVVGGGGSCWTPDPGGSHGTHVAGTIVSAANDGIGGTGVNWSATIIPIRALGVTGSGWDFDVATAISYAGGMPVSYAGAPGGFSVQIPAIPIVNMSIGSTTFSTAKANAITAIAGTTLIIASAGNNANSVPSYPAAYPEVIGVSALAPGYGLSYYSNFGSYVSISAPGGDVTMGTTTGVLSSTWNYVTGTGNYSYYQGTSMASPHVTGVAALIKAANPSFTPAQVKQRLLDGAVDRGAAGRDNIYGYGVVNAYRSITGNTAPAAVTTVRAVNAAGTVVKSAVVGANGSFAFTRLPDGDYQVVASQDEGGDGLFGVPGRRFGGSPVIQSVSGTTVKNLAFTLSSLTEVEPNGTTATAQPMVVNSWVAGSLDGVDVIDLYKVTIATAGTYAFETSGVYGSCGYALDARTSLRLLSSAGAQLASNGATAYPATSYPGDFCSLITQSLTPGQYFVEVSAAGGVTGAYRLHLRSGN